MLTDPQGRPIGYLRLSLTPSCPMRCTYCRPKVIDGVPETSMSPATIENLIRHLAERWSLRKVRLTGGEPTARGDLGEIIERVARIDGIEDLAMTTNGLTMPQHADAFRRAGLHRVNISLDSLQSDRFQRMTGVKGPDRVIAGIDAAIQAGLQPVRLNAVVLAGENDTELAELARFAADRGLEIRFIELMPMGPLSDQWSERYVPERAMWQHLEPAVASWEALPQGHDSARRYRLELTDGRRVTAGFITPMSCNFCAACNRLRITADGELYPCLMDRPRGNILDAVQPQFDPDLLDERLHESLQQKASEHPVHGFATMTILGG